MAAPSHHVRRLLSQRQRSHAGDGSLLELVTGVVSPEPSPVAAAAAAAAQGKSRQQEDKGVDEEAKRSEAGADAASPVAAPSAYLRYLQTVRSEWNDMPDLTITYEKLSLRTPSVGGGGGGSGRSGSGGGGGGDGGGAAAAPRSEMPSLYTFFRDQALAVPKAMGSALKSVLAAGSGGSGQQTATATPLPLHQPKSPSSSSSSSASPSSFRLLHACSGVLRPGVLTLVLAPPGHGKSALLKTLAGRMQNREEGKGLSGTLRWNGLTAKEMEEKGLQLSKLCAYCDQVDLYVVEAQKKTTQLVQARCVHVSSRAPPSCCSC
jgi:hypothetical protein